ncbi:MAG: F0F1 ATP synthase subunit B [Bifidobacteriaceae bacterium]|jgi:F-type H+-transporting ATPase subunit b|nr:F0F1 ATP synthase subunit B [Bifidobacteriaceae bacterium]
MTTASGVPEGIFLFIPPLYEVILSALCLAAIAYVVVAKVVPTYLKVLDERTAKIEGGIRRAEEAEAQIAEARARSEAELEEARAEAGQAREEARSDAAAIVAEARRKAVSEAERIQAAAKAQIAADAKAAEVALRTEIGDLATQLAERIVGEALKDPALSGRVVDRFLDELAATGAPAEGSKT